jgi:type IV secretion system protein VirD4
MGEGEGKTIGQKIGGWLFMGIIVCLFLGAGLLVVSNMLNPASAGYFDLAGMDSEIFQMGIWLIPVGGVIFLLMKLLGDDDPFKRGSAKGKSVSQFYSNRWMTSPERDKEYFYTTATQIKNIKKTGTLLRFEATANDIQINMCSKDYHTIVLGTTGSGKSQTFVFPMIYTLGHSGAKPNMVITDPKGELFNTMSQTLRLQGYDVQVFNLSEPMRSSRWNPFETSWDMFQRAQNIEKEIKKHTSEDPNKSGLRVIASSYPPEWYEFNKIAFPSLEAAENEMRTFKQRLLSDAHADVKDVCEVICPITNEKDPSWEQGARDLIQGTALAMLEDSLNPELGMTKERFNFYNIYKTLTLRDNDPQATFKSIKNYFEGRGVLSPAATLAQTVVANAENTMKNFFGVATQKLSMFADKGICYITSGTDITFANFLVKPTAFFLIIPDQIKIRHPLATLCVAQLYKALVNLANERGGKLPWDTYMILDEFGNMPKFENFATIITVSRSRRIFWNLIIQDYKQLETTYGPDNAVTIRNNCNTQIFIGVNDMDTRKMFSDLMGEMEVETANESFNRNTGKQTENDKDSGSKGISYSKASRPLLPPNELLDLKDGVIYVYCFGFHPLKSKATPFYQCINRRLIKLVPTPDEFVAGKFFDETSIFYDIRRRNDIVLRRSGDSQRKELFEW